MVEGDLAMRKVFPLIVLFVFMLVIFSTAEAGRRGETTVDLRACTNAIIDACRSGAVDLDGVTICFRPAGEDELCGQTEDGEWWFDSLPHGSYWARTEGKSGYQLVGASCTTHPNIPYSPCQVNGSSVHFVVHKDLIAVAVNFMFVAE
jgi:hypothetical protein